MTHLNSSPDEKPEYTYDFDDVYRAELDYVVKRREKINELIKPVESDSKIELPTQIQFPTKDVEDKNAREDSCTVSETPPQSLLNRLKDKWDGWRPLKSLFTPIYQFLFWGYPETPKSPPLDVKPSDAVKPDTDRGLIGLALSGGGVRSATFNLGLLQSLAKNKVLQYCDYLSTVSGGGYIGSCLSALLAKNPDASTTPQTFPLRDERDGKNERAEVNHLRATKNYLKSGGGLFNLDTWNMIGIMVSGIVLMSAIPVALLLMMVLFLFYWNIHTSGIDLFELFKFILPFIAIFALIWMVAIRFRQVNSSILLEKALAVIGLVLTLILALFPFLILYWIMAVVSTPVLIIGLVISILLSVWIISTYVGSIFSSNPHAKYLQQNQRLARRALVVGLLVPFLLLVSFINHFADAWYQAKLSDYSSLSIVVIFTLAIVVGVGFIVYRQFKAQFLNIFTATVLIVLLVTSCSWILAELLYLERYNKAENVINQLKNQQFEQTDAMDHDKKQGWEKLRQSILLIGVEKLHVITHYMNGLMKDWDKRPKADKSQGEQGFSVGELPSWNPYHPSQCLTGNAAFLEQLNEKVEAEKHWRKQRAKTPLTFKVAFSEADLDKWFQSIVTIAYYHCSHLKLEVLTQGMVAASQTENPSFFDWYQKPSETVSRLLWFFVLVIVLLLLISLFTNINRNALHDFYRERLSKTYLIRRRSQDEQAEGKEIVLNPSLLMKDIHACCNGPYHLINTTLNVPSSENPALHGRGADFFIFSKYYCGAESTGYQDTQKYEDGKTQLGTAMAISGAAASPEMGSGGSMIMSFIMTLLNIRLNQWMPNPNRKRLPLFTIWPRYLSQEFLRQGTENEPLLNLSDGGHHENLGIYPLLKRRCKLIIASDAGADPNYQMEDFANLQRKASIDLGVTIDIDMSPLHAKRTQNPDKKNSKAYFVKGTITYVDGQKGTLLYIKTTMTGHEPEQLLGYRRQHPTFPDETTADQFFDEAQFESYRKLGELIGEECCEVVDEKTGKKTGFDILAEIEQSLKPSSERPKIGDVELKLSNKNAEQTLRYMENVILRTDKPVTFYAGREGESSLGEQFCHLVQEIVNQDRSLLIETVREWLNRKSHQNLLWFASDIIGYFKLSELRDDLRPFSQTIMAEPDGYWVNWKLNCLWAYARFNDYREVHHLLQTTQNADTQKWLLAVYPQMVKAHHSKEDEHDEKYKDFMSEINRFLQCPGIQNDVKTEAQKVLDALKGFSKT